ncbi:dihydrolipoamide acetyltransferase family protein [Lacicoccus alkaliphilus]|uniref:Dihydrolipoamide acetyltransferase component of pyruvate dehydrogenase complex n=1 Tax=Lacicoccus alkaliphilus DSM 16010 TaxID=1123231 RepID=A0A1M7CZ65_9BACL|nr:dihydrolipoamide acetyltransferase family protein [Salinicoccus alkaliphilus]SHL72490.1 pyruvate dehydrogenase E2 component (dihydrolipoamide acetyltransferase) [Salinicoccus alkaliphilus DSM 16010]
MAEKLLLPKMGATMEEGTIENWLLEEGDKVEEGDAVVEVATDKVTIEVEAENDGVLLKKLYAPGDTVPVQQAIAFIGDEGEDVSDLLEDIESEASAESDASQSVAERPVSEQVKEDIIDSTSGVEGSGSIRRTPIARRLAQQNNLSLEDITGSGPMGRIQKIDVESHLEKSEQKITPLAQKMSSDYEVELSKVSGSGANGKIIKDDIVSAERELNTAKLDTSKRVPFKGIRKVIASRMSESFYTAPHVTMTSEIDMTEAVELRKKLLPVIEESEKVRLSYNEIIIKATASALAQNTNINVSLEDEKEIVYHQEINIGFAVSVQEGLVVPVLREVDQKGLGRLTKEAKAIAEKAKEGVITSEELEGSTFTISNLGMFAVDGFSPIINMPNAAILGVGRIQEKPIIVEGQVEIRSMMTLSLSFDHRIINGAPAAQFLTDLKGVLENPYKLMI